MHCPDTARAEYFEGTALMAVGAAALWLKKPPPFVSGFSALFLYGVALWIPEKFGCCRSSRIPCSYGMVPIGFSPVPAC